MKIELVEWLHGDGISVADLIMKLSEIVDENPNLNFNKVGVSLNQEYIATNVKLDIWNISPSLARCHVEIS